MKSALSVSTQPWERFLWLVPAIAVVLVLWPVLSNGWVYYDDPPYLIDNPLLGKAPLAQRLFAAWTTAPEANWMPLTWTAYISLDSLFGLKPLAFHGLSLALHAGNAILAYLLCQRLGLKPFSCLVLSLLWALHPLRVESVAWASSLKDLLSSAFVLASLILVLGQNKYYQYFALLCFVASLLCKQSFVALPAFLFLFDFLRDPQRRVFTHLRKRLLWWLVALAGGLVTVFVNRGRISEAEFSQPDSPLAFVVRGLCLSGTSPLLSPLPPQFHSGISHKQRHPSQSPVRFACSSSVGRRIFLSSTKGFFQRPPCAMAFLQRLHSSPAAALGLVSLADGVHRRPLELPPFSFCLHRLGSASKAFQICPTRSRLHPSSCPAFGSRNSKTNHLLAFGNNLE